MRCRDRGPVPPNLLGAGPRVGVPHARGGRGGAGVRRRKRGCFPPFAGGEGARSLGGIKARKREAHGGPRGQASLYPQAGSAHSAAHSHLISFEVRLSDSETDEARRPGPTGVHGWASRPAVGVAAELPGSEGETRATRPTRERAV